MQFSKYTHTHTTAVTVTRLDAPARPSHHTMLRTRGQRREARDRIEEGGGEAMKRKKPQGGRRRDLGNGGDLGGKRKKTMTRWGESGARDGKERTGTGQ